MEVLAGCFSLIVSLGFLLLVWAMLGADAPAALFLLFVIGGAVALIVWLQQRARRTLDAKIERRMREPGLRVCPFCAETIRAAALLCPFCGSDLPLRARDTPVLIRPARRG